MSARLCSCVVVVLAACAGSVGNAPVRLRTAIDDQQDSLDECYTKSLARDAETKGTMDVVLHVVADGGRVESVSVGSSEIDDPKLGKCVKGALGKVTLDPPPTADFEIQYTLDFGGQPEAEPDADAGDDAPAKPAAKPKKPKPKKPKKPAADDTDDD